MTSGDHSGTNAAPGTFLITVGVGAVLAAVINTLNVMVVVHNGPSHNWLAPIILEASSWTTEVLSSWIPWIGFCLAPPLKRPSWRLVLHIPVAFTYSICHVGGFVLLRKLIYLVQGSHYDYGPFWRNFSYESGKDALTYALFIGGFALLDYLLRRQRTAEPSDRLLTFDIRDGTKLIRVRLEDVLAVSSAGNYVEFVMGDGRKLCMRSPLSALEKKLGAHGFLRTHRSWLVNVAHVSGLNPEGSGDYSVSLGTVSVPLSRRYPEALARLRAE